MHVTGICQEETKLKKPEDEKDNIISMYAFGFWVQGAQLEQQKEEIWQYAWCRFSLRGSSSELTSEEFF